MGLCESVLVRNLIVAGSGFADYAVGTDEAIGVNDGSRPDDRALSDPYIVPNGGFRVHMSEGADPYTAAHAIGFDDSPLVDRVPAILHGLLPPENPASAGH